MCIMLLFYPMKNYLRLLLVPAVLAIVGVRPVHAGTANTCTIGTICSNCPLTSIDSSSSTGSDVVSQTGPGSQATKQKTSAATYVTLTLVIPNTTYAAALKNQTGQTVQTVSATLAASGSKPSKSVTCTQCVLKSVSVSGGSTTVVFAPRTIVWN